MLRISFRIHPKGHPGNFRKFSARVYAIRHRKLREFRLPPDSPVFVFLQRVFHQFSGILPFVAFIVRPSAGKKRHDKGSVAAPESTGIAVTGIAGKARLPGKRAVHHMKERIVVRTAHRARAVHTGECIRICLRDRKELRILNRVRHDSSQIGGRGRMNSVRICRVQPVRGDKVGALTAKVPCLLIHKFCKRLHTSSHRFRDDNSSIIFAFQHQRIEKIAKKILLSRPHAHPHGRLRSRICRNLTDI